MFPAGAWGCRRVAGHPLARLWAAARTLRLADGPDEVHLAAIAKEELKRARGRGGMAQQAKL